MTKSKNSLFLLKSLWACINYVHRRQFGLLLLLILATSFSEVVSIGLVLPFLSALSSPQYIFNLPSLQPLFQFLYIESEGQILLPLTILFGVATLLSGAMRISLVWATTRLSFSAGADLSLEIYRRTLYQPYSVHLLRNSSEIINGVSNQANSVIYGVVMPVLNLISAFVMLLVILSALLLINPSVALISFIGFGLIYIFIIGMTRRRLARDGRLIAYESAQVIRLLQEGLGGIRDILIDGTQKIYCAMYGQADASLRRAQGNNVFTSQSPRYYMEALGMLIIAALAYRMANEQHGVAKAIPVLGALALGAQRLLPVLQQAYSSWTSIQGNKANLEQSLCFLAQPLPAHIGRNLIGSEPFRHHIRLYDVSFRYSLDRAPWVLNSINLLIAKGAKIGFVGKTGSGKSTLLDILMGLLKPTEGFLEIDGKPLGADDYPAWQAHIAHVPQTIFLADMSIEENIAFGVPREEIDCERVRLSAEQAQLSELVDSWPEKYQTMVGERGVRLSGGQRQRIGIARALYKNSDVIIFDEATSSLDSKTEEKVMQAIESLNPELTILIVAHRLSTLRSCTQIVELVNGCIGRIGSYEEVINPVI